MVELEENACTDSYCGKDWADFIEDCPSPIKRSRISLDPPHLDGLIPDQEPKWSYDSESGFWKYTLCEPKKSESKRSESILDRLSSDHSERDTFAEKNNQTWTNQSCDLPIIVTKEFRNLVLKFTACQILSRKYHVTQSGGGRRFLNHPGNAKKQSDTKEPLKRKVCEMEENKRKCASCGAHRPSPAPPSGKPPTCRPPLVPRGLPFKPSGHKKEKNELI